MTADVWVRRADERELAEVARVVAGAFTALPAAAWLVPEPDQRVDALAGQFTIIAEHANRYGDVHLVDDEDGVAGAAVWLDYTTDVPEPRDYRVRLQAACGKWVDRFVRLDAQFAAHHPSRPHHHLALLAVRPDRQGQGIGSALLAHHHTHLDRYAIGGYMEASSTGSRRLYQRHGYQPHGDAFDLADGARFWPMWRPPHPSDDPRGAR